MQEGSDFPGLTHISESSKKKTRPVFPISGEEAQKRKDRLRLLDTAKQPRQEQGRATRQPRYVKPEWFKKEFQESPGVLDRLRKSGFKPDINFWLQLRAVHRLREWRLEIRGVLHLLDIEPPFRVQGANEVPAHQVWRDTCSRGCCG